MKRADSRYLKAFFVPHELEFVIGKTAFKTATEQIALSGSAIQKEIKLADLPNFEGRRCELIGKFIEFQKLRL